MARTSEKIPQIVPSSRCFACDVCCRFPEKHSFLRPYFTAEEIGRAVSAGISREFFPDPDGCQIELVSNPVAGGEGYVCPCWRPDTGACAIYDVRPFDCRLFPVALMRDSNDEGVLAGLDTKCPYLREHPLQEGLSDYVSKIVEIRKTPEMLQMLRAHPGLIQRYQDDVVAVVPIEEIRRQLKGGADERRD